MMVMTLRIRLWPYNIRKHKMTKFSLSPKNRAICDVTRYAMTEKEFEADGMLFCGVFKYKMVSVFKK